MLGMITEDMKVVHFCGQKPLLGKRPPGGSPWVSVGGQPPTSCLCQTSSESFGVHMTLRVSVPRTSPLPRSCHSQQ